MNLPEILRGDGLYVWPFTRFSNCRTISAAQRRVMAAIAKPPHNRVDVSMTSCILTDTKTYESEPALVINVQQRS